jgi:hypothetical protein
MRNQLISVVPNPYLHLDDEGNPSHVVAVDPSVNSNRAFVGATLSNAQVVDRVKVGELLSARQYNTWEFTKEPVQLMLTPYYLACIKNGELIPADEATAKVSGKKLEPIGDVLTLASYEAAKDWYNRYGEYPNWYTETTPVVKESTLSLVPNGKYKSDSKSEISDTVALNRQAYKRYARHISIKVMQRLCNPLDASSILVCGSNLTLPD